MSAVSGSGDVAVSTTNEADAKEAARPNVDLAQKGVTSNMTADDMRLLRIAKGQIEPLLLSATRSADVPGDTDALYRTLQALDEVEVSWRGQLG